MPRDATKYAGGHTSALGELFIADERERMQGEVYKFDSRGRDSRQKVVSSPPHDNLKCKFERGSGLICRVLIVVRSLTCLS